MGAGSWATTDTFPRIEPSGAESITCRSCQNRCIQQRAVEKPMWKRAVIPSVAPKNCVCVKLLEVAGYIIGHSKSIGKLPRIITSRLSAFDSLNLYMPKMPCNHE